MLNQFVVETNKQTVGVAVRVPGGFRFFYSDPRFSVLDGQIFRRVRQLARTVGELAQKKGVGRTDQASSEELAFHGGQGPLPRTGDPGIVRTMNWSPGARDVRISSKLSS